MSKQEKNKRLNNLVIAITCLLLAFLMTPREAYLQIVIFFLVGFLAARFRLSLRG